MSAYREQVADALRAVRVTSPTSFRWFGRGSPPPKRAVRSALDPPAAREYLVARLEQELYRSFYLHGRPLPRSSSDGLPEGADPAFVAALSDANAGTGGWAPGWRVVELRPDGGLVAERDGLALQMDRSQLRAADAPPAVGGLVSARVPKEHRGASPGFYLARGDAAGAAVPGAVEVRVYFNLAHAGAVPLLAAATRRLNEAALTFAIKLVDHPARYARCDAAVLYLEEGGFSRARAPLRALVAACAPHLRAPTPAFTKALAPGVGVGEHVPALGASFGAGRCRLLAEAVVDAYEQRRTALGERVDVVARRFALHGLDLDLPYLVSGGRDDYRL